APSGVLGEGASGPDGEVAVVDRHLVGPLSVHLNGDPLGLLRHHLIEDRHGVEDVDQVVVATFPERADRKLHVDLRGHTYGHRTHRSSATLTTCRGQGHSMLSGRGALTCGSRNMTPQSLGSSPRSVKLVTDCSDHP